MLLKGNWILKFLRKITSINVISIVNVIILLILLSSSLLLLLILTTYLHIIVIKIIMKVKGH